MEPIAHIHTDFDSKFGIPRQSGLISGLIGRIVMEPKYRVKEAFRGLEEFSHIWLLWDFSQAHTEEWSPTVRPPRLGGNMRVGVFATRSPFRPNNIGLTSVRLLKIDYEAADGPVIFVDGVDMVDNTPIYDIKPYLPFTDIHSDAVGGFTENVLKDFKPLEVCIPEDINVMFPEDKQEVLVEILKNDPRPQYQADKDRIYGFSFCGINIHFQVDGNKLSVIDALPKTM